MDDIDSRIEKFRAELVERSANQIVRRHLISGSCVAISDDAYFELSQEIADHFDIHPNEVLVVGSGKLGFSIAPTKRYKHFGDESDLDVTIVSGQLFDAYWDRLLDISHSVGEWDNRQQFLRYFFDGWIRPDKFPQSKEFPVRQEWFEYFRELTSLGKYGPYKISAGIYRAWDHIERYQGNCVEGCASAEELRDADASDK